MAATGLIIQGQHHLLLLKLMLKLAGNLQGAGQSPVQQPLTLPRLPRSATGVLLHMDAHSVAALLRTPAAWQQPGHAARTSSGSTERAVYLFKALKPHLFQQRRVC